MEIRAEMVKAMKAKDATRLSILRLINAKMTDASKEKGKQSNEVEILDSMIKERIKTIAIYEGAGETERANQEQYEIDVITEFLPKRLTIEEIETKVAEVIAENNFSGIKDMGKAMGILRGVFGESAKPSDVSMVVKNLLS